MKDPCMKDFVPPVDPTMALPGRNLPLLEKVFDEFETYREEYGSVPLAPSFSEDCSQTERFPFYIWVLIYREMDTLSEVLPKDIMDRIVVDLREHPDVPDVYEARYPINGDSVLVFHAFQDHPDKFRTLYDLTCYVCGIHAESEGDYFLHNDRTMEELKLLLEPPVISKCGTPLYPIQFENRTYYIPRLSFHSNPEVALK